MHAIRPAPAGTDACSSAPRARFGASGTTPPSGRGCPPKSWTPSAGGCEHQHPEPLRPVAAQLEEIIEVNEAHRLEFLDQPSHRLVADERPHGDQLAFDAKLLVR